MITNVNSFTFHQTMNGLLPVFYLPWVARLSRVAICRLQDPQGKKTTVRRHTRDNCRIASDVLYVRTWLGELSVAQYLESSKKICSPGYSTTRGVLMSASLCVNGINVGGHNTPMLPYSYSVTGAA